MGSWMDTNIYIACRRQVVAFAPKIKNAPPTASHKGGGGGMGGWVGLQKLITDLDMRNGHKGGVRVGFININDMYNNDVGKGGAYDYEAYEAK